MIVEVTIGMRKCSLAVPCSGFRIKGCGLWVQGSGFRIVVEGFRFQVEG